MKIKIVEEIETVGFREVQEQAPQEIAAELRRQTEIGALAAAGRVVNPSAKASDPVVWVVVSTEGGEGARVILRQSDRAAVQEAE